MIIKDVGHRREAVTAINVFDEVNGIRTSQRAKYEKPMWYYILAVLPPSDKDEPGMTVDCIIRKLAQHNIVVKHQAVYRTLIVMINKSESIHPHRRNCGVNCYDAVGAMGDIEYYDTPLNEKGRPSFWYILGANKEQVNRARRAYNIRLKP